MGRDSPADSDGASVQAMACPVMSSSTPSSQMIQARTAAGLAAVVTSRLVSCSVVSDLGCFSATRGTLVITRGYRTTVRTNSSWRCLGGDPGERSGAVSRLGGDQRRQRLRSSLDCSGWVVIRCDAGAAAGPTGLRSRVGWSAPAGAYASRGAPTPSAASAVVPTSSRRCAESLVERYGRCCRFHRHTVVARAMLLSILVVGVLGWWPRGRRLGPGGGASLRRWRKA